MGRDHPASQLRLVLDIFLVIALVFAIGLSMRPSAASAQLPAQTQAVSDQGSSGSSAQDQPAGQALDTATITDTVILDNETLAAWIAAENSALFQPQFLTSLPVVIR